MREINSLFPTKATMSLKLHKEIGWIVSHAWSFRFLVLAAVFSGAEAVLPLFMEHPPLPRRLFAVVVFVIVVLALVARVIVQQRPPQIAPDDLASTITNVEPTKTPFMVAAAK